VYFEKVGDENDSDKQNWNTVCFSAI
jgi:hypothetical protein